MPESSAEYIQRVYDQALLAGNPQKISWEDQAPNEMFTTWAEKRLDKLSLNTALVPGCGLGYEAEFLSSKGLRVTGFDFVAGAVEWAKKLHKGSKVDFQVADLRSLPRAFFSAFDLVVEVFTIRIMEKKDQSIGMKSIAKAVAPGGTLFFCNLIRPPNYKPMRPDIGILPEDLDEILGTDFEIFSRDIVPSKKHPHLDFLTLEAKKKTS